MGPGKRSLGIEWCIAVTAEQYSQERRYGLVGLREINGNRSLRRRRAAHACPSNCACAVAQVFEGPRFLTITQRRLKRPAILRFQKVLKHIDLHSGKLLTLHI